MAKLVRKSELRPDDGGGRDAELRGGSRSSLIAEPGGFQSRLGEVEVEAGEILMPAGTVQFSIRTRTHTWKRVIEIELLTSQG
jgi:hypothetical protein